MGRRRSKKIKMPKIKRQRSPNVRHRVRQHKRKINGRTITVKTHFRGEGTKKPNIRRPRRIETINRSRITNRQFLYGDFDKDKTKNIDDIRPYNPKEKGSKEEILLSDELKNIETHRESFEGTTEEMAKDFEKKGI